eukprot:5978361-Pleurochrysis_carterae.AAC.1
MHISPRRKVEDIDSRAPKKPLEIHPACSDPGNELAHEGDLTNGLIFPWTHSYNRSIDGYSGLSRDP